jgi:hypothetical protein
LPQISKIKEQAKQNELAAIEAFTRVCERIENEPKFTLKPEHKEFNDIVQNVVESQISPVLQQIRDEINRLTTMVEK